MLWATLRMLNVYGIAGIPTIINSVQKCGTHAQGNVERWKTCRNMWDILETCGKHVEETWPNRPNTRKPTPLTDSTKMVSSW